MRTGWLLAALLLGGCASSAAPSTPPSTLPEPITEPSTPRPLPQLPHVVSMAMRALAVPAPAAQVDALGLAPKDHVDLLVTGAAPDEPESTGNLIENVAILTITPDPGTGERLLIVLVTPQEAQGLAMVAGHVPLSLALRHEEDVTVLVPPRLQGPIRGVTQLELVRAQRERDEAVTPASVARRTAPPALTRTPLPARVPAPGMRAIALQTTAAGRLGDLLQPGDRVDVIALSHDPSPWARTIAQNLEVLGVAGEPGEPGAVSVGIRAADAALLAAAGDHPVAFSLRNPEDVNVEMELAETTWANVFDVWRPSGGRGHTCPPLRIPKVTRNRRR